MKELLEALMSNEYLPLHRTLRPSGPIPPPTFLLDPTEISFADEVRNKNANTVLSNYYPILAVKSG